MSHTPGPWVGYQIDREGWAVVRLSESTAAYGAIGQDNARLIAAAPDLLAACQALLAMESDEDADNAAELIRDAIEKATGARPQ
jgi:hypothetical protein